MPEAERQCSHWHPGWNLFGKDMGSSPEHGQSRGKGDFAENGVNESNGGTEPRSMATPGTARSAAIPVDNRTSAQVPAHFLYGHCACVNSAPSIQMVCPLINDAPLLARKTTVGAMSAAVPTRPKGVSLDQVSA